MTKSTFLLVALAITAAGVGLLVFNQRQAAWNSAESPSAAPWLGEFDVNAVEAIVVRTNENTTTLRKTRTGWTVAERHDYPADFMLVGELVRGLRDLRPVQIVQAGPSRHAGLELLEPDGGTEGAGTLIELLGADGDRIAAIIAGKQSVARDPSGRMPPMPNGRFIRRLDGGMEVGLVDDFPAATLLKPSAWLDREFIRIDGITSIAVEAPGMSWRVTRDAESQPWTLEGSTDGEKANQPAIDPLASLLGNLSFIDVGSVGGEGFEKSATIAIGAKDGSTVVLEAGGREGAHHPVMARVEGKPTGGADAIGRFEGRVFHLPAQLIETVLKPRDALVTRSVPSPSPMPQSDDGESGNREQ